MTVASTVELTIDQFVKLFPMRRAAGERSATKDAGSDAGIMGTVRRIARNGEHGQYDGWVVVRSQYPSTVDPLDLTLLKLSAPSDPDSPGLATDVDLDRAQLSFVLRSSIWMVPAEAEIPPEDHVGERLVVSGKAELLEHVGENMMLGSQKMLPGFGTGSVSPVAALCSARRISVRMWASVSNHCPGKMNVWLRFGSESFAHWPRTKP